MAALENTALAPGSAARTGVLPRLGSNTAGSGRGPWYLARTMALSVGLSNTYFTSLGLPSSVEEG